MSETYRIKWTFTPPDYFEESIHLKYDDIELWIEEGEIKAELVEDEYGKVKIVREKLHESLNNRFLGVQVITHKPYELSKASIESLNPDGGVILYAEANIGGTSFMSSTGFTLVAGDGNIIVDKRKERIEKIYNFADLVEKYKGTDAVVDSIVLSYHNAVEDPDNELVHLYEIRDALQTKFGGKESTKDCLNISNSNWQRFGELTCVEPLNQGRHRGQHPGNLRDATQEELKEARKIAQEMIESYLGYLENQHS